MDQPPAILATDVGSTTTKAILIEHRDGRYRLTARGESPTTVEAPHEDVMVGVVNALHRLEEASERKLLDGDRLLMPSASGSGADVFLATSSAGGGLQMAVAGIIKNLTAESAQRAALGAGAIVMDVISIDDARLVIERIRRLKELRPDMILLSGGTDEGDISHVAAIAEYIAAANPRPRLGGHAKVPVIYAGNTKAREYVEDVLGELTDVRVVDNIRPRLERETLGPARAAIHDLFLEHVMARAPGYRRLLELTDSHIQPTPMAVGKILQRLAEAQGVNVLAVDIGGATTDVFSIMNGKFNRTVSANLGMSYSLANVMVEAGVDSILRWLPFSLGERELRNWTANKMIRPTTLPQDLDELIVEHALAREALRLSFQHHRSLAVTLRGVQQKRTFDDVFTQRQTGQELVDLARLDVVVGSGGVLANAPRPAQAMLMLIDSLQPQAVSRLFADSVFTMPHLGALSDINPEAALDVLVSDCLVPLGACVAPRAEARQGELLALVHLSLPDGRKERVELRGGQLIRLPLGPTERAGLVVEPRRNVDMGAGPGHRVSGEVAGGEVGLVLDGRGRPIAFPSRPEARVSAVREWLAAMGAYEESLLLHYERSYGGGGRP
jgi:uncharacterized protein (TIGR01319 family)